MQLAFGFHQPPNWTPYRKTRRVRITAESLARRTDLRPVDKAVFSFLEKIGGEAGTPFPAHATIAEMCGISLSTVKRSLTRLKTQGLVSWKRRSGMRGNAYYFHKLAWEQPAVHAPRAARRAPTKIAHFDQRRIAQPEPRQEQERKEERPSGRSAETARETLAQVTGKKIPASDPLPGQLVDQAEAIGAKEADLVEWIEAKGEEKAKRGARIYSPGFFVKCFGDFREWFNGLAEQRGAILGANRQAMEYTRGLDEYHQRQTADLAEYKASKTESELAALFGADNAKLLKAS